MADTNESIGSSAGDSGDGLRQLARREMTEAYIAAVAETSGLIAVAAETKPTDFKRPFAFDPVDN